MLTFDLRDFPSGNARNKIFYRANENFAKYSYLAGRIGIYFLSVVKNVVTVLGKIRQETK